MTTRITFTFGDDGSEKVVVKSDEFARALLAALKGERDVQTPTGRDFWELASGIASARRAVQHLDTWSELAIVAADKTSDNADRNHLGIAAAMPPSRIYRILERHGRPRNRKPAKPAEETS